MSLTKEECEKSLRVLKKQYKYLKTNMGANYPYTIELLTNVYRCFEQLIKEHFELLDEYKSCRRELDSLYEMMRNKPLKFEDLHDFMPVFDVTTGFWIMITSVINRNSFGGYVFDKKDVTLYFNLFTFEENRLFRSQVIDDE